ncbi:MAG: phospholipid/cholesterol/gamma-HCH transport system substrate-binding protein, partial [Actinomycetota bacterium]|nr:phospholipid/cholesterol/gamma-HCH transport system substrate-binding protein [Actinomycetota bacterium]
PTVVGYFRDVGELVARSSVQLNDVKVGSVDDIQLVTENGRMLAKVTMSLSPSVRLPATGLRAIVRQTSLLGEQFVDLVPTAQGPPFVSAAPTTIPVARTERRVSIETFLSDLSGFIGGGGLEDLNRFTHAQALILQDRGERFGETIHQLRRFTSVLAHRRFDIASAIDHLNNASSTIVANRKTLDSFLNSLQQANSLLASQGSGLVRLFRSLDNFGSFNARFLARHEDAINRGFKALKPVLAGLSGAQGALRKDLTQLRTFFELFPKSFGGGPGGTGHGDYIQAQAVLCQELAHCHTKGEKGDVPGQGS